MNMMFATRSTRATAVAAIAAAVTAILLAGYATTTEAALVDAGTLTTVSVYAPLYDTRTSAENGCDPYGCIGEHTRDGDTTTSTSRWSCQPALGADGSTCSITYTLGETLTVESLNIVMYQGDERTRTMDIYIDGVLITTWTSSGITTEFETVALDVSGYEVQLVGVLDDSEWLSILEVEILVDDGSASTAVEASTLEPVTASASYYDARLAVDNGCDPYGCTADLTRDGDLSESSRWSCSPSLGGDCTISFDLGAVRDLYELRLAMHLGTTRTRTVQVYVDGYLVSTWTSSGTTDDFERIDVSSASGQVVEITGVLADSEWLSIVEVEINVENDSNYVLVEAGEVGDVIASASYYDTRRAAANGCDPYGCTADHTRDGDLSDGSRWSCSPSLGGDCIISYDLGAVRDLYELRLAMYMGTSRTRTVYIYIDGSLHSTWTSSGTTADFESIDISSASGQFIDITGVLSDSEWLSILETEIVVWTEA